jgi:predicted nucleic acid-binding Zn finger protein
MRRFYGTIETVEQNATNVMLDLTNQPIVEVNMAKSSLPKVQPFPKVGNFVNLTNQIFGRLTVLAYVGSVNGYACWTCSCSCGEQSVVKSTNLRCGHTVSCGCRGRTVRLTHGMSDSPEYEAFQSAKIRCTNPSDAAFKDYGERGIEFRFESFAQFFAHIGKRPTTKHSLDRKDVNGHYEIGNVRWATPSQQQRNRRDNVFITYQGQTSTRVEWSEKTGIRASVLRGRQSSGWCEDCTFSLPLHSSCRHRTSGTKYDPKPRVEAHKAQKEK